MGRRVTASIATLVLMGAGLVACSDEKSPTTDGSLDPASVPDGFTAYEAGDHTISVDGTDYQLKLQGPAALKVDGSQIITSDAGDNSAITEAFGEHFEPYRASGGNQQFYFVMTDRFANGDPSNDDAGLGEDRLVSGFDPTDEGFYLGGDIRGIIDNLDYIQDLGATAIWLTPPFKNQPVQGPEGQESAGYHGYWITDFTQIDPHYGTNDELQELVIEAQARGIKIYFDVITNHTADVIQYEGGDYSYVPTTVEPYTDAEGNEFNAYQMAGQEFPELDPETSFPYLPVPNGTEKVPEWLNDVTLYHNRGNSTWSGESVTYGDFDGLDDLMTENPVVVDGMVEIYKDWIDMGVDGFRIDTVKHVNYEFWEVWTEEITNYADDDFFMFGEVYDANPAILARYPRGTHMDSVLDFAFQSSVMNYVNGAPASVLSSLFASDALYVTPTSSPNNLPTFLGNHDMGRVGYLAQGEDKLAKSKFAHALMFTMRGRPVVYYGDEQGFVGTGGDKAARQPLFPTEVESYQNQPLIDGTEFGTDEHMSADAEMYQSIKEIADLRKEHTGLSEGAQIELYADGSAYAFSRIDPEQLIEYVVFANAGSEPAEIPVTILAGGGITVLYATDEGVHVGVDTASRNLTATVPPLGVVVVQMEKPVERGEGVTALYGQLNDAKQMELMADSEDDAYETSAFFVREVGTPEWTELGVATGPDARVFHDTGDVERGTLLEYRVIDGGGNSESMTYLVGGPTPSFPEGAVEPAPTDVELPADAVTLPGTFNAQMGCAEDWMPNCETAQLTKEGDLYTGTFDLTAGSYEFKVAIGGTWDENYGADGVADGDNIVVEHDGGEVSFAYDPATHEIRYE